MPPLVIAGASRGVGLELARLARSGGRPVVALVRPGSDSSELRHLGVEVAAGDALSRADADRLFGSLPAGCNAVSTLSGLAGDGRRADDEGNINLIDAAAASGLTGRFLLITSIGCGEMAPYRSERAIAAFGAAVDAKTRAEEHLRRSGLAWTILRPGGLRTAPATGNGILSADPEMHGFINRADVAQLALRALRDPSTRDQAFAVVDRAEARSVNAIDPHPLLALGA